MLDLPSPRNRGDVLCPAPGELPQPTLFSARHQASMPPSPPLPVDRWVSRRTSARTSTGRHIQSDIVLLQAEVKAFEEMISCRMRLEQGELSKLYTKADHLSAQLRQYKAMPSSFPRLPGPAAPIQVNKEKVQAAAPKVHSERVALAGSKVRMSSQELRDAADELGALDRDLSRALSPRADQLRKASSSPDGGKSSPSSRMQPVSGNAFLKEHTLTSLTEHMILLP